MAARRPTPAQARVLRRMAAGAVLTYAPGWRAWWLKAGNDYLCEVRTPRLRALRDDGLLRPNHGDSCFEISDAGRAAIAADGPGE